METLERGFTNGMELVHSGDGGETEGDVSDSTISSNSSDCTFDTESVSSATEYSEADTDDDMPALTNVDDDDEEEESDNEADDMPALTSVDDDDDEDEIDSEDEETDEVICEAETEDRAFVTTTFEGRTPAVTLTFMDSGASDLLPSRIREDFTDYTPVCIPYRLLCR